MKKVSVLIATIFIMFVLSSCSHRIGKLVVVSTKNIDSKIDYVLVKRDVTGKAKSKKQDALEIAIDRAVKQDPNGDFLKDCIVKVSWTGKKIIVTGDVWGHPVTNLPTNK